MPSQPRCAFYLCSGCGHFADQFESANSNRPDYSASRIQTNSRVQCLVALCLSSAGRVETRHFCINGSDRAQSGNEVKMFLTLRKAWAAIRWKMMIIFSFFSIVSVAMVICFSIALLNVVIRRESAYMIEERIKIIVESRKGIIDPALDRIEGCEYASNATLFTLFTEHLNGTWPGSQSVVSVLSTGAEHGVNPPWLDKPTLTDIVEERGNLEIRFIRTVKRNGCSVRVLIRIPLGKAFLSQLSDAFGSGSCLHATIDAPSLQARRGAGRGNSS